MNLFWSTRSLTSAKEDHLTEFFAAALEECDIFRAEYEKIILRNSCFNNTHITEIATQVHFPGTFCCPDMVLTLSNGKVIACEHKLDALETIGPEHDSRKQLLRYLDLPVDGLIYVRSSWKPPVIEVLNHSKYIKPMDREHFLWHDFYSLLAIDNNMILKWLKDGFDKLGFTPAHPLIGELSGQNKDDNISNRKNFAKLWLKTRSYARSLGWTVNTGSIVELYLKENPSSLASWIFISPAKYSRFLFRVTPKKNNLNEIIKRLHNTKINIDLDIQEREIKRKNGLEQVVDITSTLNDIIGKNTHDIHLIENNLLALVGPLLQSLQMTR